MTATSTIRARAMSDIWAAGLVAFAGAVLLMIGIFQMIGGIAALADDKVWLGALATLTVIFLVRGAADASGRHLRRRVLGRGELLVHPPTTRSGPWC